MKKNLLNLKMAVIGLGMFISAAANAATFTAVLSGNWSNAATWGGTGPSGVLSGDNVIIPAGMTVTMDMDVNFSGTLLLTGSFNVNGTLTNTTNNGLTISQGALTGTGMISIRRLTFTNTGTSAFTGTMNVGTLSNANLTNLGFAAIANVSDSLILESGVLNLGNTSNLTLMTNSTIRVNSGSLTNSGVFNTSNNYNVMYVGSSKLTGLELSGSSVQNVWIKMSSNTQSVTLNNNFTVNGNLTFTNGKLNMNGKKLTLMGDLNMSSSNAFMSNSSSEMVIAGSGALTSSLMFDAGSAMNNMTINRSSSTVKLMSALAISGHLNLMNGVYSLESGSTMSMTAGSTIHIEGGSMSTNGGSFIGTAAYNVEYMGAANSTSGTELTGSGLNNLMINYTSNSSKTTLNGNATVAGAFSLMNGNIDLNGKNLTLNGTMSQSTVNSMFMGSSNSELNLNITPSTTNIIMFDQNSNTLSKLKINLATAAAGYITLGNGLTVMNELNFIKGQVALGSNSDLIISSTGSVTGYDNTKYIITSMTSGTTTMTGRLQMMVNTSSTAWTTFPVGTMDNYSPAYVQQTTAGTSGNFMLRAANEFLTDGLYGSDLSTTQPVVKRTWHVDAATGVNVNMNLKLGWMASSEVNGFNRNSAILRHYTSSAWDVSAIATASAGANSTYEVTRTGLTSLSPFAVSDANSTVGIKEIASSIIFDLYPNPAKEAVSVKAPNAGEFKYEMIDITGRTLFTTTNSENVNKFDVSKLEKGFYFVKVTDLNNNNTTGTKRFIKD